MDMNHIRARAPDQCPSSSRPGLVWPTAIAGTVRAPVRVMATMRGLPKTDDGPSRYPGSSTAQPQLVCALWQLLPPLPFLPPLTAFSVPPTIVRWPRRDLTILFMPSFCFSSSRYLPEYCAAMILTAPRWSLFELIIAQKVASRFFCTFFLN